MSMLKSLKGLQRDLATGFKSLTTGGATVKSNPEAASEDGQARQLGAGAELLNRFQTQWEKLHQEAEQNACAGEDVDQQVTSLYLCLEQQNSAMTQLVSELTCIPQLLHNIQQSMDMIGEIEVHCSELDTAFEDLRDVYRECELRSKKQHHQYQLVLYQQRRELELEQVKVQFARKHAHAVESYEAKMRLILREKQQACEDASKQEMEHYRLHGHTQLKPSTSPDSQVDLADISLDQDLEALDAFLQTDTGAGGNDMSSAGSAPPNTATDTQDDMTQLHADGPADDTGQYDTADTSHLDTVDTGHSDTVDMGHSDTVDTGQSDTIDTGHSDTNDTDHSNNVDTGQSDTVDMNQSDTVKQSETLTSQLNSEDQHHK